MSNELATTQQNQLSALRQNLAKMEGDFKAVLPAQIPAEKFIRTLMTAVQMQPDLLQADRKSLYACGMKAAQDGLLLDGREAAPVIFNKKAPGGGGWEKHVQYMPMLGGLLKKLRNSGEVATIAAHVVYDNDHFDYELGDDERISHKPILRGPRGEAIAVYCVAKTKDGAVYREVMSVEEVEKIRAVSRSKDSGPWVAWWDEMAKKSVIRRICKRLPSSADVDSLLAADNENYDLPPVRREASVPASIAGLNARLAAPAPTEAVSVLPEDEVPMGDAPAVEAEVLPPAQPTRPRRAANPPKAKAEEPEQTPAETKPEEPQAEAGDGEEWGG